MSEVDETLYNILKKIAEENNFVDYKIKIEAISSGGSNYTSTLYNVTIEEADKTHHMFVKVAAIGEKLRKQVPRFYENEIFVYTKLLKIYNNLEELHKVPDKYRLKLCKFYGCDPTIYKETVAIENLVIDGYQAYNRFKSIDWEYGASAMTELSKMHALSFAYSVYYPEEFNKALQEVKFEWNMEEGYLADFFDMATTRAVASVREETRDNLKRFFETCGKSKFTKLFKEYRRPALIHGDYKPSNLMHKTRSTYTHELNVVKPKVKLVEKES